MKSSSSELTHREVARPELWFRSVAFICATVVIGGALQISNGHLNGTALILLTFALAAVIAGLVSPGFPAFEQRGERIAFWTAAAGLALQLCSMFITPEGIHLPLSDAKLYWIYLGGIVLAAAVALLSVQQVRPLVWLPLLCAVHFALGVWMIRVSPTPGIDVFYNQTAACRALSRGLNPYAVTYPDVYSSPRVPITAGRTYGYPPVSYLCAIPGYLAGDIRYSHLAAMSLIGLLIAFARPSQLSALMAALFLFTPRTLFVLECAWTEPFVLLFMAAALFSKVRGYSKMVPVFLGLLISSKQHLFLIIPAIGLLMDGPRFRWKEYARLVGKVVAVGAAVTLPFALWNPEAFYRVLSNFSRVPPIPDSLSYSTWLILDGGPYIAPVFDLMIAFAALGLAMWLAPRSPSAFAGAVAAMYFVLFLFSVNSFCNYYYMVLGLLCIAVAFADPQRSRAALTE